MPNPTTFAGEPVSIRTLLSNASKTICGLAQWLGYSSAENGYISGQN